MIPTNAQLELLRTRPHLTRLFLSVYQPSTVLAARVNNTSSAKGDRSITFDSVTAGSYLLVRSGMTMYVGTTAGARDKGSVRVRSATSTVLTVAENSHINWSDNDYLTVVSFFEINAIYPRIIQDPADETNTLWYKDYDVTYTDQNSVLGSFVNMGSHYAAFLENGSAQIYYSASGTYNVRNEAMTYSWFFEGATVTGSSANTPGNITYNTAGHYTTRLTVTTAGGASDTSYRHISIYDATHPTIRQWELTSLSGSKEQGGWVAKIRVRESIPHTILTEGSLIVVFADNTYTGARQSINGSIVFVGYILKGSVKYNYRESSVEFEAGSPSMVMKESEGFAVSVQFSSDPSTATTDPNIPSSWVTVLDMDVRRAIYHYLRWHSTVLMTNDFEFKLTDRYLQFFDSDRTSLYDAINSFLKSALTGGLTCDRRGKLWAERDIYIEPSTFQTSFTLANGDWIGDVEIEEALNNQTSFIEMGGIHFNGTGYTPLLSNAPGTAPGYRGGVKRIQGLALLSQEELNQIAGSVLAQDNIRYPAVELSLAGNYNNFDLAPQEIIPLTLSASDTIRGISFTNKSFFLSRMEWVHQPEWESFMPRISLRQIGSGVGDTITVNVSGSTVTIPDLPDTGGFGDPGGLAGFDFPIFEPPSFGFGGGGTKQTWQSLLTATGPSGAVYPVYAQSGGIAMSGGQYLFHFHIMVPPQANGVRAYFVYYQTGSNAFTCDASLRAIQIPATNLDTDFDTFVITTSVFSGFEAQCDLGVSWTPASNYVIVEGTYDLTMTGGVIYALGFYLSWTN